jgi:polyferredoxin
MQTLELGYVNAGFVLFAASIALTLVVGRFFCGWACHLVAYQDLCRALLERIGCKPRPLRSRLLRLAPFAAAAYMFVVPTVARWWSGGAAPAWTAHFTTDRLWRTFPGPGMATLTILVDGALVVWWLGAKGFCTYGCPYGALFGLADRVTPGRIVVSDACEGCGHCTAVCTSNVRVHDEVARFGQVVDSGCMKCLDCVRSCPKEALRFSFAKPSWSGRVRSTLEAWSSSRADLTWTEELLAGATALVGVLFCFRELYSQVPFLLAIGLAMVGAIAVVVLSRALTRRELVVQSTAWKRDGRFTRVGATLAAASALFLAFELHSGLVQSHTTAGRAAYKRWREQPSDRAAAAEAESQLTTAVRLGLFTDGPAENSLAALCHASGRNGAALDHLRRALAVERKAEWLAGLALLLAEAGRRDEARAALREAAEREPDDREIRRRLEQFDARPTNAPR